MGFLSYKRQKKKALSYMDYVRRNADQLEESQSTLTNDKTRLKLKPYWSGNQR